MSKRFNIPFNILALLTLAIGMVHFASSLCFSADTYSVPQTAEVKLAWDPNDPAPDGYHIYQRTEGQSYEYSQPCWTGSGTSGSVYNLDWDTTYYFVVRAYVSALESADSEEVSFVARTPEPTTYTISSVAGEHGSISPGGTVVVPEDSDFTVTIIPESGYHVLDVKVDGQSKGAISSYSFSQVTTDHTIDASFAVNTHTISAVAGANGNISPAGNINVDHGASQTLSITPAAGYRVANVIVDGVAKGAISSHTFSQVTANHTIDANFTVNTYTINASAGANGSISPVGSTSIDHGASQTFIIAPDDGYRVANVNVDGVAKGAIFSYTFEAAAESHTISADFAIDTHQITASAGANGSISPSGIISVDHHDRPSYTILPAIGHHVGDVLVDGVSMGAVSAYTFNRIEADHTIHATFAADTFAINATATANGTITPDGVVDVTYGGSQTYTFAVDSGFCIADVQVDGQSMGAIGSYTFSNVTCAHTISVDFSESTVVSIRIEAEDGNLFWPMEIGDDLTAAAAGYIWVPTGSGNILTPSEEAGYAEYQFEVPETGDYVIWGRQISNDSGSDSFFIAVDGQTEMTWHTMVGGQDVWTWDVVSDRAVDDPRSPTHPQKYRLETGFHNLTIKQREDGTKLDTIFVTNDVKLGVSDIDSAFQAPVIEVDTYDPCISEFGTATISLDVTDPGNGNLTYAWELPDGGSISGSGSRVEFIPESIGPHPCPYQVTVLVTSEATLLSTSATFNIYVRLAGDVNTDGIVNVDDKKEVRNAFGQSGIIGWIPADVNHDGIVNIRDKMIVRNQFGQRGCACQ